MIAIGTDVLRVARVDEVVSRLGERFVARILTPQEQQEYRQSALPNRLLAKRFAAKEAVAKALGTGIGHGVSWQDICVEHDDKGAPTVVLSGGALAVATERGGQRMELSIADEEEYVVAFAVLTE